MTIIADPLFYPIAIIAVSALGLSKGGFAGVGVMSTPLLATILPPLQAAAILLPILITQDVISVWVYRRDWSAWHLKVMLPGGLLGIAIAWALATQVSDAIVRLVIGLIGVSFALNAWFGPKAAEGAGRRLLGRGVGLHLDPLAGRRSAVSGLCPPATAAEAHARGHLHDLFRRAQCPQDRALFFARPVLDRESRDLRRIAADRSRGELPRHLAGAPDAHRTVLSDRLCAGVPDLARADPERGDGALQGLSPAIKGAKHCGPGRKQMN